jgi:hypothetical protein
MQRATHHRIIGDQLGVHHGALHVWAASLNAAQAGFGLEHNDANTLDAGASRVLGIVGSKAAQFTPGSFRHVRDSRGVWSRRHT